MQFGISTYSLSKAIRAGEMDLAGVIAWIAEQGADQVEISAVHPIQLADTAEAEATARIAADHGLTISSYTVGGNFLGDGDDAEEVARLRGEVDKAAALGVTVMRHDCGWRPKEQCDDATFEADLPRLADGARQVAEYAADLGITTTVENHGFHVQRSHRVLRLVEAVGLDNYRITVDVGNFLCGDEDPVAAVRACMPLAAMVHLKDFYIRDAAPHLDEGWIHTPADRRLRGAIVGYGDIDMPGVLAAIAGSGYDGCLSIEFEGMEDCRRGVELGLANLKTLWQAATVTA